MTFTDQVRRFLETGEGNADHLVDAAKLVSRLNEKPFVDWLAAVLDLHYEVQAAHERGEPVSLFLRTFAWELGATADFAEGLKG